MFNRLSKSQLGFFIKHQLFVDDCKTAPVQVVLFIDTQSFIDKMQGFSKIVFFQIKICNSHPGFVCQDRKSTRLNSSHVRISYAVFCLKKKKNKPEEMRAGET